MFRAEYFLIKLLDFILSIIPFKIAEYIAIFIAFLLRDVFRLRRKIILENLLSVYGGELPCDKKLLIKNIYRNFTFLWFELLQTKKINRKNFDRHFHVHNINIIDKYIKKGTGVLLISGHFGNFEWVMPFFGLKNYHFMSIMKKLKNPYVNRFIINLRQKSGSKIVLKNKALKEGTKLLKQGGIFGIVADQNAGRKGVIVDFLGRASSTAAGPAIFALRTGAAVIFTAFVRRRYGMIDVFLEEVPLNLNRVKSENRIKEITQAHTKVLEKWILKFPEQWFWMHRRWKARQVK
jgi:KDO2-lipid IV(A) lauroyltransferase